MHQSAVSPQAALEKLLEGNRRYTSGQVEHPRQSVERRTEVLAGQHPFAILLSCSDSRVSTKVFFDQGIGDLFIIRNAGNIVDDVVFGSIEYAVEHLGVPLVMVLGHTQCGAVTAAVQGGEFPGHIGSIVAAIQPAVAASKDQAGDAVINATLANVRLIVDQIKHCEPILAEMVRHSQLTVVGGIYHLDSGVVEIL